MDYNNNCDYNWYNSSFDQGSYSNEGRFYSDSSQLQPSLDHQKLDVEEVEGESKLGLKLTKTESLLNLLNCAAQTDNSSTSSTEKNKNKDKDKDHKATNFPALSIHIGSWKRESRHEGELVAKCYFKKRQLVWEVLFGNLKSKIEVQWSNILAMKAKFHTNGPGVLDVMLAKPPLFFRETKPQPRKHTNWDHCDDFTHQQASLIRKHKLIFAPGILEKHYFKIIQADPNLSYLSQQPFPYQASAYFNEIHFSNQFCYENNYHVSLPPQIPPINPSVMDFSSHTSSATYPIIQGVLPNNEDLQFAISSSMSQESSANFQQLEYAYPCMNDVQATTDDVGLNPFDYPLPNNNYLQQMNSWGSQLPYMGNSSYQSSYDYEESVADQHQSSHEYQSQHHYDDFYNYNL